MNSITSIACCERFDDHLLRNARSTILSATAEYPNLREVYIHVLPRRGEHVGSDEERDETLSSVIAWLENNPTTTFRKTKIEMVGSLSLLRVIILGSKVTK